MIAARNEHFQLVQYLIEQGEADLTITTNYDRYNVLALAARYNENNTNIIQFLLENMSPNDINHRMRNGCTPLDYVYMHNDSGIKDEIIELIRKHGGIALKFNENGELRESASEDSSSEDDY